MHLLRLKDFFVAAGDDLRIFVAVGDDLRILVAAGDDLRNFGRRRRPEKEKQTQGAPQARRAT